MLGAICGDVVGSRFEWAPIKTTRFQLIHKDCRFTDDTVLTCAVAEVLLDGGDYASALRRWFHRYPEAGYGARFAAWAKDADAGPYRSLGNGSAMRVSPVGWYFPTEAETLRQAAASAAVTHNHPEGIKGAQAVALAIFLLRNGIGKEQLRAELEARFGYDLSTPLQEVRPSYTFDLTCNGSVPQAIRAFLEADNFESALRNAISLGGDADTQAAIAGALAQAHWGIPGPLRAQVLLLIPTEMRELVCRFEMKTGAG